MRGVPGARKLSGVKEGKLSTRSERAKRESPAVSLSQGTGSNTGSGSFQSLLPPPSASVLGAKAKEK